MSDATTTPRGCSFLLTPAGTEQIFTPEQFTDDQRTFARTASDFMEKEIFADIPRLERQEPGLMVEKLKKAGEIGLLMIDVPEEYGGMGLDKTTSMLCSEKLGTYGGFSVSHGAHVGIGSLPLVFFGNDEQKQRYLPRLAVGEILAAYALTEPGSGSDALGAKTTAVLSKDDQGRPCYVLNGTKMWITNAGFADLYTVFAKVDGDKFTAFLVEASYPGVSTGAEEHKMGIKGSSTRMLILEDVRVPVENVLGEIGRGHKIAFNILNFGRYKLGVGVLGGAKHALTLGVEYSRERKQFGQTLSTFGAIQEKIADSAVYIYALESMCYRVAGYFDTLIGALDAKSPTYAADLMAIIEDFAVEDSIMKVFGSEVLDRVVDHGVQIHGGYGYSQEYAIERSYRDSRINRIFEGTNEINRMLIPGIILKRTMKGELQLFDLIQKVEATVLQDKPTPPEPAADSIAHELFLAEKCKELFVFTANLAIKKHMADFKDQQELMIGLADILSNTYAIDSTLARIGQLARAGQATSVHFAIAKVLTADLYRNALEIAMRLAPSLTPADKLARRFAALDKFSFPPTADMIALRRHIAAFVIEHPRWAL